MRSFPSAGVADGCVWQRNMSIRGLAAFPVRLRQDENAGASGQPQLLATK